jgi:hypothetical protein
MQLVTFHGPHIKRGVGLAPRRNDVPFVFGDINSRGVAFENVAEKLFCLFEVDAFLAEELVVDDGLVESKGRVVVLRADTDCSGGVVVKGDKVLFEGFGVLLFPLFKIVEHELVFGGAY